MAGRSRCFLFTVRTCCLRPRKPPLPVAEFLYPLLGSLLVSAWHQDRCGMSSQSSSSTKRYPVSLLQ